MDSILVAKHVDSVEKWVDARCRLSHPRYVTLMCWPTAGTFSGVQVLCQDDKIRTAWVGDKVVYHGNMNFSVEKGK